MTSRRSNTATAILYARNKLKWTHDQLAEKAGVSPSSISNAEKGVVNITTAETIARGLGYASLGDLLLQMGATSLVPVPMYVGGDVITIWVERKHAKEAKKAGAA